MSRSWHCNMILQIKVINNINIRWTYADPSWSRIAALVPVVVACAETGDEVANNILLESVEELALSVKAVIQRLGLAGEGMELKNALSTWRGCMMCSNCIYPLDANPEIHVKFISLQNLEDAASKLCSGRHA